MHPRGRSSIKFAELIMAATPTEARTIEIRVDLICLASIEVKASEALELHDDELCNEVSEGVMQGLCDLPLISNLRAYGLELESLEVAEIQSSTLEA